MVEKFINLNDNVRETREKQLEIRYAPDFQTAMKMTALMDFLSKSKNSEETHLDRVGLNEYERQLLHKWNKKEGESLPVNILSDIDGVLVETDQSLKKLLKALTTSRKFKERVTQILEDSKISFRDRKILLEARNLAKQIVLITDRFGVGPCFFPCLGEKYTEMFKEHGIDVFTSMGKGSTNGAEFLEMINKEDITYYIGSNSRDKKVAERMHDLMDKEGIPSEKLVYIQVETEGKKNIF